MAKNNNLTDFLTNTANAIREAEESTETINPQDFEGRIKSLSYKTITGTITTSSTQIETNEDAKYCNGHFRFTIPNLPFTIVDKIFIYNSSSATGGTLITDSNFGNSYGTVLTMIAYGENLNTFEVYAIDYDNAVRPNHSTILNKIRWFISYDNGILTLYNQLSDLYLGEDRLKTLACGFPYNNTYSYIIIGR